MCVTNKTQNNDKKLNGKYLIYNLSKIDFNKLKSNFKCPICSNLCIEKSID